MNQILYSGKTNENSNKKIIITLVILLVIILVVLALIPKLAGDKILANVYIGDVAVGSMTKDEATTTLQEKIDQYANRNVTLILGKKEYQVSANEMGFCTKETPTEMVDKVYGYGRNGNIVTNAVDTFKGYFGKLDGTEITYMFNGEKLDGVLDSLNDSGDESLAKDDSFEISGDVIYITKGSSGEKIDKEETRKYIISAILKDIPSINVPLHRDENSAIDMDKIYDEVYVAPTNASYTVSGESFEVNVEKPGKYFKLDEAKKQYEALANGETMTIKIEEIKPEITVADLDKSLFKDVLATYSTEYDESDKNRVTNLKVATERCNDTILYPGDEFSYNKALGTRNVANGFAPGHSFAGGRVVTTIGGGICQVSSTLYNVVLMADLEVTNRVAHGMYVEYVKPSLDATVVDGAIDFKFKNNRSTPVKLEASAKDGVVSITLYGIKSASDPIIEIESNVLETLEYKTVTENDPTMEKGKTEVIQSPVLGYVSEAYRIEKDASGNVISKKLISKDKYIATNEIIKVGTKEETVVTLTPTLTPTPTPVPTKKPTSPEGYGWESEDEENENGGLPSGWDSPESPYGNN